MSVGSAAMGRTIALLMGALLLAGCKESRQKRTVAASPPTVQQKSAESLVAAEPAIAACGLVASDEIGAIQGATITDAKSSASPTGDLLMSQCYYSSNEPNMAVSLAVIQPSAQSSSGSEARDYWVNTFGQVGKQSASEKGENEEAERRTPPKKIDGIGEEAYWNGNRFGGALYVLKNNVIVRVSVGGPGTEEVKINKSKAIAEKAISRL